MRDELGPERLELAGDFPQAVAEKSRTINLEIVSMAAIVLTMQQRRDDREMGLFDSNSSRIAAQRGILDSPRARARMS
jgi:hypothetical protein